MEKKEKAALKLVEIKKRISQKRADYERYNLSQAQNDILKTFFDLSQEYSSLEDFYQISVTVLKEFMDVEARLYLLNEKTQKLEFICDSRDGLVPEPAPAPEHIVLTNEIYGVNGSFVAPVLSKAPKVDDEVINKDDLLLGSLEVLTSQSLSEQDKFFLGKFANRIGYNLHNRQVALQNIKHLQFINTLVMDIEHNVIIPNMYFKHLFNRIRSKIRDVQSVKESMNKMKSAFDIKGQACEEVIHRVTILHQDLIDYHQEMLKHHSNCSLFLESLFRRDHFEKGYLVLHAKKCLVETEVILPQLEQFAQRIQNRGISIDRPVDMSGEPIPLNVDIGLLSQVYANFFSNAEKYTEQIVDHAGSLRKALAYGREFMVDYFGPGRSGVKFNFFTTGRHLDPEDANEIFNEGYRGKNSLGLSGTGHGLTFVRHVVEMHGGRVGYEPTSEGNNFFFILPIVDI